jgi:uncharacterized protein
MAKNPFRFGEKLLPAEVVDRREEIARLVETFEDAKKLFLIGPRRHGKTVVLHAAEEEARAKGWHVFYFNAEAATNLGELSERIFAAVTARLVKPTAKLKKSARDLLARLSPNFQIDLTSGTVSGSLNVAEPPGPGQLPILVDVLDTLEALAREQGQPVGLIIDEFQAVVLEGGAKAEGQIRAAIQDHRHVGYVFAGSRTRLLAEMTGDQSRPFWRLGGRLFLGRIPEEEMLAWLAKQFRRGDYATTPEALRGLLDAAEQVPYDIQRLAHAVWQVLERRQLRSVTEGAVRAGVELLTRQDAEFYLRVWNQLSAYQKIALTAVERHGGAGLTTARVLKAARMSAPTMLKSLSALEEKGVLWAEDAGDGARWRFEDPLFRQWIRTRHQALGEG